MDLTAYIIWQVNLIFGVNAVQTALTEVSTSIALEMMALEENGAFYVQ